MRAGSAQRQRIAAEAGRLGERSAIQAGRRYSVPPCVDLEGGEKPGMIADSGGGDGAAAWRRGAVEGGDGFIKGECGASEQATAINRVRSGRPECEG